MNSNFDSSIIKSVARLSNWRGISSNTRLGPHAKNVYPLTGNLSSVRKTRKTVGKGTFGRVNLEEFPEGDVATKYFTSDETVCENTTEIATLKFLQGLPFVAQLIRVESKPANVSNINAIVPSIRENLTFPAAIMGKALTTLNDSTLYTSWDQIVSVVKQVLLGYYVLHSNRIVHRDTKPRNMLMTSVGEVWVTDFGMSKYIPPYSKMPTDVYTGTPPYAAPELLLDSIIFKNLPHDFFKSDSWAVGASLYEIVVGNHMISGYSNKEIINEIFKLKGTPTKDDGVVYELFEKFKSINKTPDSPETDRGIYGRILRNARHKPADVRQLELISSIINDLCLYNPTERISIKTALERLGVALPVLPPIKTITQQYMKPTLPSDINEKMLDILFDWLYDVVIRKKMGNAFVFDRTGVYTMAFLNTYRDSSYTNRKNLQLIGIVGCLLANCFFNANDSSLINIPFITAGAYTQKQVEECIHMYMTANIDFFGKTFFDELFEHNPDVAGTPDIEKFIQTYGILNYTCFQKNLFPKDTAYLPRIKDIIIEHARNPAKLGYSVYLSRRVKPGVHPSTPIEFVRFAEDVKRTQSGSGAKRKKMTIKKRKPNNQTK